MDGAAAAWRRWFSPPARDAVLALAVTVALLYGAYGEAHPSIRPAYFQGGHHLPQTPRPRSSSSAVACLALAWRRRWPVAVLGVSVAAATIYTLLGYVNGAVLVAPMVALYTVAAFSQPSAGRWATGWRRWSMLGSASIAVNPFGQFSGGGSSSRSWSPWWWSPGSRWRTGAPTWTPSATGPNKTPAAASTRNGCASPASCTTWWPTPWPPSTCRPGWPRTCCPPARRRRPSPCRRSRPRARRGSGNCAPS